MEKNEAKKRIQKLREVINRHRYLYHVEDRQEISDHALDSLKKELFDMEQQFPELITLDSPTQRVAGKPLKEFKKVRHQTKMMSLEDVFSEEEFSEWVDRLDRLIKSKPNHFYPHTKSFGVGVYAEPKFDGLALSIVYEGGVLKYAATRGDGQVGEDV